MEEVVQWDEGHFGEGGKEVGGVEDDEVIEESLTHEDGDAASDGYDEDDANHVASAADEGVDKATFAGAVDDGDNDGANQEPKCGFVEPPVAE